MFWRTDMASDPSMLQLHIFIVIQYYCAYCSTRQMQSHCRLIDLLNDAIWNASNHLIWFLTVFVFFKTGIFRAGSVKGQSMRIPSLRQFRRFAAQRFDRSRKFCGIRLEVSLYYVCHRIFSLVTLLYVQRITCGNLWTRMLKISFVDASDRPNLLILWVQIRIGWFWCKDHCR